MTRKETARKVISKLSGKEPEALRPEMELVSDLGIDSPKALELLVELEEALGVEISDDDAAKMETVGDIESYALALDG